MKKWGVLRHPPLGALCFVTLLGLQGACPLPLGEPSESGELSADSRGKAPLDTV